MVAVVVPLGELFVCAHREGKSQNYPRHSRRSQRDSASSSALLPNRPRLLNHLTTHLTVSMCILFLRLRRVSSSGVRRSQFHY